MGAELVQDLSEVSSATDGFLLRHRHRIKTTLSDSTRTDTYVVDYIDRAEQIRDAVAVLAFARTDDGTRVLLRRQLRYAAYLVTREPLWTEVIAGIIELPETPVETAKRELVEEAGIHTDSARLLGQPFFPTPGAFTERIHPVIAELDLEVMESASASGDGHAMEEGAELISCSLGDALTLTTQPPEGVFISDAKTEIMLHRLAAHLGGTKG